MLAASDAITQGMTVDDFADTWVPYLTMSEAPGEPEHGELRESPQDERRHDERPCQRRARTMARNASPSVTPQGMKTVIRPRTIWAAIAWEQALRRTIRPIMTTPATPCLRPGCGTRAGPRRREGRASPRA